MAALNICLIGHRGVGKSTFLTRVTHAPTFDLDAEVERAAALTIDQIFEREGEAAFRAREADALARLLAKPGRKIIAVGAGFAGPKPAATCVWLRRATDAAGRAFLNRPRLDARVSPLTEYLDRFAARERRFAAWADFTLLLPEGYDGGLEDVFDFNWRIPFDLTLTPEAAARWTETQALRASWNLRRLEVRDDLTPNFTADLPTLRSYRVGPARAPGADEEDWALELGPPPRDFAIVSVHAGTVADAIERLAAHPRATQKLAVEVRTFGELRDGHHWWSADPTRRAFLPRDPRGRWRWYRSLFGPRMPLHFVREGAGSSLDQPPLWQTRLQPPLARAFAAVLGHPVEHSRTPIEHRAFFAARAMPTVAIDVGTEEFDQAWPTLRELGLTHAAVTAPLKEVAFARSTVRTAEAELTRAANTLCVEGDEIHATNTDVIALRALSAEFGGQAWLWGGGGVKSSVRAAWPRVREISARAGLSDAAGASPDLLIWAVGRARAHRAPPAWVRPKLILDLNYAEDSPGLEYAVQNQFPYQSGLRMFKLQAAAQREFWQTREESRAGKSIR